jgi:UDP-N-acetylmuramyl tripeptide synthase
MDPRLTLALAGARATGLASRLTGRGGGTAAPGLVAERVDPAALGKLGAALSGGALVVGGTNGKPTTAHMVATILDGAGRRVIHNRSGSNLVRGVLAALAAQSSLGGVPRGEIGVIEADEAALPAIVAALRPRFLLLNNLFRDQLDRYGELDHIATRWRAAVAALDATTTLIVNADDPMLVGVTEAVPRERVIFFGLATADAGTDRRLTLDKLPHAADAATCSRCGGRLAYRALYLSHLGDWHCPACGHARPLPDLVARDIVLDGVRALSLTIEGRGQWAVGSGQWADGANLPPFAHQPERPSFFIFNSQFSISVPLPGLYNAYNALAAATAALAFGATPDQIKAGLAGFTAAFGRIERVSLEGREVVLALVKNPTGFNEVLRMLVGGATDGTTGGLATPTLLAINDLDADGRDVSWLWDVDFEVLASGDAPLHTAGIRGPDMAVRLKYAGVAPARIVPHPPDDLRAALLDFVRAAPAGATLYILPTYTAMLETRRILADLGAVRDFWRQ